MFMSCCFFQLEECKVTVENFFFVYLLSNKETCKIFLIQRREKVLKVLKTHMIGFLVEGIQFLNIWIKFFYFVGVEMFFFFF